MYKKIDINYYLELQRRFEDLLLNVSMHQDNYNTFSIKMENLFVDACAFFDSLCQTYIVDFKTNGLSFKSESSITNFEKKIAGSEYFNINDYQKLLESEYTLSIKEINLNTHTDYYVGNPIYYIDGKNRSVNFNLIKPFESWASSVNPAWWKDFTCLKHNRLSNIKLGNLRNLTYALGAAFIVLTLKNEHIFKAGQLDKEIYNIFFPNYWVVQGISASRGNIVFHD